MIFPDFTESKIRFDSEVYSLINESERHLHLLSGCLSLLRDSNPLITALIYREALKSILIESPDFPAENFYKSMIGEEEKSQRIIFNYANSLFLGRKLIRNVSDSIHIIKSIHSELYKNIFSDAGKFTSGIETGLQMEELHKQIASNISYPNPVNAALIHARFDLISPFDQGSGATGRILSQLLFLWKKQLPLPVLQISNQILKKKTEYADRLLELKQNNSPESWIKFYLKLISAASEETLSIIKRFFLMREDQYNLVLEKGFASVSVLKFFDLLIKRPVISLPFATKELGFNKQNANIIIAKFLEEHIIEEITGQKRNRLFTYKEYLNILD